MCASILEESDAAVTKIVPLTVEQYHRMIEAAILPQRLPGRLADHGHPELEAQTLARNFNLIIDDR